jgi:C6 transcription factor GliZ
MPNKLRTACDHCHHTKVRCSGQLPCKGCVKASIPCFFSLSARLGRPKGTKNRTTEEGRRRSNKTNNKRSPTSKDVTTDNDDRRMESSSDGGSGERFELPNSHSEPTLDVSFEPSFDISPRESDFSQLLWTDLDAEFLHHVAPSNEIEPTLATPPSEILLGKQPVNTSSCACMQQQVELLCKSRVLNAAHPSDGKPAISMDVALALVEEGMGTWQMPIMCPACRCNDDQEVILLAFMSIQLITRCFQRLVSQARVRAPGPPRFVSPGDCPIKTQLLMLGSFPITGEDRLLLLRTLVLNTLRKMGWILTLLQRMLEEKRSRFPPEQIDIGADSMPGNTFYMQQMFDGLSSSLRELEESVS